MKILLTGGCGYIGSVLVPKLLGRGHKVAIVDTQSCGNHPAHTNLKVWRDDCGLSRWVYHDAVIHLATNPADPWSDVIATERLAAAASRRGVRQFILASHWSVYGPTEHPATEDLPCAPVSVYAQAKMVAERVLLSYAESMSVQIIRPATVCGLSPRMRLDTAVNRLTMQALNRGRITVKNPAQVQPFMHIEDVTDLYCFMIDHPELTGVFNAGAESRRLSDVAEIIAARTNAEIVTVPGGDHSISWMDTTKLKDAGFSPVRMIKQAVDEMTMAHNVGDLIEADEMYRAVA